MTFDQWKQSLYDSLTNSFSGIREILNSIRNDIDNIPDVPISTWVGTQSEYDSIETKDDDTLYLIKED